MKRVLGALSVGLLLLAGCAEAPPVSQTRLAQRPDTPNTIEASPKYASTEAVESIVSPAGHFRVHFTRQGTNTVELDDADKDGTPDYVALVAETFDAVHKRYHGELSFRQPFSDQAIADGNGGDERFDVYLLDFGGVGDGAFRREGCNAKGCTGYMVMENDFSGYGYPSTSYAVRILASHEYFHAVQAAYAPSSGALLGEGTAVWATESFDPTTVDLETFAGAYLERPDRSLATDPSGPLQSFAYSAGLFFAFLSERYGEEMVRKIWEEIGSAPTWTEVLDAILKRDKSTDFSAAFVEFCRWNTKTAKRADSKTSYSFGGALPEISAKLLTLPALESSVWLFSASTRVYRIPALQGGFVASVGGDDLAGIKLLLVDRSAAEVRSISEGKLDGDRLLVTHAGATDGDTLLMVVDGRTGGSSRKLTVCVDQKDGRCIPSTEPDAGLPPSDAGLPADAATSASSSGGCSMIDGGVSIGWPLLFVLALCGSRRRLRRTRALGATLGLLWLVTTAVQAHAERGDRIKQISRYRDRFGEVQAVRQAGHRAQLRSAGRRFSARINRWAIVQISRGANAEALFSRLALFDAQPLMPAANLWRVRSRSAAEDGLDIAERLAPALSADGPLLQATPDLELARQIATIPPNDPLYGGQWYLPKINIEGAWRVTVGDSAVKVAVVDNGCDLDHADLQGNLETGYNALSPNTPPTYIPNSNGNEHGTACVGLIGAVANNKRDIAGICSGCRVRCVRLLNAGQPVAISADVAAYDYQLQAGVAVSSNSWGFVEATPVPGTLATAIETFAAKGRAGKGAVVVFAAGNDSRTVEANEMQALGSVINVGAVNLFGEAAPFSNSGKSVALTAPTGSLTLDISGAEGANSTDTTDRFGGTSAAAPVVAGVAALMLSANPQLTAAEVRQYLIETTRKVPFASPDTRGHDPLYGFGVLNAEGAVRRAAGLTTTPSDAGVDGSSPLDAGIVDSGSGDSSAGGGGGCSAGGRLAADGLIGSLGLALFGLLRRAGGRRLGQTDRLG
ncbi:MAG: S8 family serine peptidase [Deltaproteobacteria bacterium]|nr:S8 family serine peptidase [Deltaproteobacteria bacterium]